MTDEIILTPEQINQNLADAMLKGYELIDQPRLYRNWYYRADNGKIAACALTCAVIGLFGPDSIMVHGFDRMLNTEIGNRVVELLTDKNCLRDTDQYHDPTLDKLPHHASDMRFVVIWRNSQGNSVTEIAELIRTLKPVNPLPVYLKV